MVSGQGAALCSASYLGILRLASMGMILRAKLVDPLLFANDRAIQFDADQVSDDVKIVWDDIGNEITKLPISFAASEAFLAVHPTILQRDYLSSQVAPRFTFEFPVGHDSPELSCDLCACTEPDCIAACENKQFFTVTNQYWACANVCSTLRSSIAHTKRSLFRGCCELDRFVWSGIVVTPPPLKRHV